MRRLRRYARRAATVELTWAPAAGEVLEISLRRVDPDNRWIVRCSQAGSFVKLIARVAGVEREYDSARQTWTVGRLYTVRVEGNGSVMTVYVGGTVRCHADMATFNHDVLGISAAPLTNVLGLVVS